MTKEQFLEQLKRASTLETFPVSAAVFRCLAEDLQKGNPAWWVKTAEAWAHRDFVAWNEAWGLFMNCVHYEALSDADNPLVPYFPSCGGTNEADPAKPLREFLASPPKSFFENLKTGEWRPFIPAWSSLWVIAALQFFHRRTLPFYLVQVNAGAGLDLAADAIYPNKHLIKGLVAARIGLDVKPLLVEDILQRRWLTAGLLPDQTEVIPQLDHGIDVLQGCQKSEANFLQLVPCAAALAPKFLAKNIPPEDPEVGLLVFNIETTARMKDAAYAAYARDMVELLRPWGDRGVWIEVERVRGELYSTTFQLRARRMYKGHPKYALLGYFDVTRKKVELGTGKIAAFLDAPYTT